MLTYFNGVIFNVSERLLTPVRTLQQLEREVFETIDEENYIEKFLKNK